ncbi:MAG: hypothetical protein ABJD68_19315 [Nakamurella sp.]
MSSRAVRTVFFSCLVFVVAAGLFFTGRATADPAPERAAGYTAGHSDGYLAGLRAGRASGEQQGRALQEGIELPADSQQPVQDAFNAGYSAGSNAAFGQFDGGWGLATPYVVTLEAGETPIAYRFSSRTPVQPGIDYYLCADGTTLCQEPRP